MDKKKEKLVQEIGNEVCEECGPNSDCGLDPSECDRVAIAVTLLDNYIKQCGGRLGDEKENRK